MSSAVLCRSTNAGTIELSVSDRTAARAGVAQGEGWDREFRTDPLSEWREKLKRMDAADRKREQRRRKHEAPMTDLRIAAGCVVEAFPLEPDAAAVEARRGVGARGKKQAEAPPYPNGGRWFLAACRDRAARGRGVPGNCAPGE